jgi:O-antigen ligase
MATVSARLERMSASPDLEAQARSVFRQVLFVIIMLAVWISVRPFAPVVESNDGVSSGDTLNQVTFSGLALLTVMGLGMADRRALLPLLQPSWLLMMAWVGLSVLASTQLDASFRAAAFTFIAMGLAAALFALPQTYGQFQALLFACAAATLAFAWMGVIVVPDMAIHTDFDPFEPEHAGSWRGHFDHKNIAGGMMVVLALVGIYAMRAKKMALGLVLLAGAVVFLYMTRSKTSLALLPVTLIMAMMAERLPSLFVRMVICLTPVFGLMLLTAGSAFFPGVEAFNKAVLSDPTFTGRFDIWRYGFEKLAEHPWTGYGFEAFWKTPTTMFGESKLELAWEVGKIVHGHNAYLDVALTMGLPGLLLALWCLVIKPVVDFDRAAQRPENRIFASFCLTVWLYVALAMCLESYLFRRADPVWFALLLAVFGLRFSAAYRIGQQPSPTAPGL